MFTAWPHKRKETGHTSDQVYCKNSHLKVTAPLKKKKISKLTLLRRIRLKLQVHKVEKKPRQQLTATSKQTEVRHLDRREGQVCVKMKIHSKRENQRGTGSREYSKTMVTVKYFGRQVDLISHQYKGKSNNLKTSKITIYLLPYIDFIVITQ